jgi:hypothetical protein
MSDEGKNNGSKKGLIYNLKNKFKVYADEGKIANENKIKSGRPKQDITRDANIRIRVTTDMKNKLRAYAERNDFSMSQVVEMSLHSFMFEDFEDDNID